MKLLISKRYSGFFLTPETLGRVYISYAKKYSANNPIVPLKVNLIKVHVTKITWLVCSMLLAIPSYRKTI